MKLQVIAVAIVAVSAWFNESEAQPQIDGASGEYTEGAELLISGTGFGRKDPVEPALYDDFENGTDGEDVLGHTGSPWTGQYGYDRENHATYSDSLSVDGRGMCAEFWHPVGDNLLALLFNFTPTGKTYLDVNMKMKLLDGFPNNIKTFRLRRQSDPSTSIYCIFQNFGICDTTGVRGGGFGVDNIQAYQECRDDKEGENWTQPSGALNLVNWAHLQWCYGTETPGVADGYAAMYINGEVKAETNRMCWMDSGGEEYDQLVLGHQAGTAGRPPCPDHIVGSYSYYDYVYFDTTYQRIEIGNSSVYNNCTKRMIQIPTGWSPTQVVADVNLGTFDEFENLYAFVIDEDNQASNGYPVRVVGDQGEPGQPGQPIRVP